jgi:methylenetetrahydrofolate reductase (NADPH)
MSLTIDKLSSAAANWSIEVTPTGASKVESFADVLEPQTCVNVTFLPGSDPADTLAVACRLHEEGMIPIPHIAARSIKDKAHLQDIISALAKQAYVSEVLVIGGGVDKPVGEFDSSIQILKSGILQSNGIFKIGVAGHPEGSPDISSDAVRQALHEKNELADVYRNSVLF